jgi:rhodanese-related sulfurtransferase
MIPTLTLDELREKLSRKNGFTLVEALTPTKYRKGHIPGAINVPFNKVDQFAAKRLPDKNQEIVVYCGAFT